MINEFNQLSNINDKQVFNKRRIKNSFRTLIEHLGFIVKVLLKKILSSIFTNTWYAWISTTHNKLSTIIPRWTRKQLIKSDKDNKETRDLGVPGFPFVLANGLVHLPPNFQTGNWEIYFFNFFLRMSTKSLGIQYNNCYLNLSNNLAH
jgi:hypothetical protein